MSNEGAYESKKRPFLYDNFSGDIFRDDYLENVQESRKKMKLNESAIKMLKEKKSIMKKLDRYDELLEKAQEVERAARNSGLAEVHKSSLDKVNRMAAALRYQYSQLVQRNKKINTKLDKLKIKMNKKDNASNGGESNNYMGVILDPHREKLNQVMSNLQRNKELRTRQPTLRPSSSRSLNTPVFSTETNRRIMLPMDSSLLEMNSGYTNTNIFRNRYTNWEKCSRYLSSFDIQAGREGEINLMLNSRIPKDFGALPIKKIVGYTFVGGLPSLPEGLEYLELTSFNRELPVLPNSLRFVKLHSFTGDIPNVPENLEGIEIGGRSRNIKNLRNGLNKRYTDQGALKEYLKKFHIYEYEDDGWEYYLLVGKSEIPPDLKLLPIENLKIYFKKYEIGKEDYSPRSLKKLQEQGIEISLNLPHGLQALYLSDFEGTIPTLPEGLQRLDLESYTGTIPPLPETLQTLDLYNFTGTIPPLPETLQTLDLYNFTGTIPPLPEGLQTLDLYNFTGTIPPLPEGLQTLYLNRFTGTIPPLPEGLQALYLSDFTGEIPPLPEGLQTLQLSSYTGEIPPLPEGLQTLELTLFTGAIPMLPEGLQTLQLSGYTGEIPALPEGLQKLDLWDYSGTIPTLPETLTSLKYKYNNYSNKIIELRERQAKNLNGSNKSSDTISGGGVKNISRNSRK
jgi:hypothetical protein